MWAVGDGGELLHNDGTGWVRLDSPTDVTLDAIGGAPTGETWIGGAYGAILER